MELAQAYGETLYTGVFYRNPAPAPTYESLIRVRQQELADQDLALGQLLENNGADSGDLAAG